MTMAKQTNRGKPEQIKLAVLETAEWFNKDRTATVRPFMRLLTQIVYDNPNFFHYANFTGKDDFADTLEYLVKKDGVQYVYICTHGENGKIDFPRGGIKNQLNSTSWKKCFDKNLSGVLFGGCQLLPLAEKVSNELQGNTWVASHRESIDWVDASLLDMTFLRIMLTLHDNTKTQLKTRVALDLLDDFHGHESLRAKLGFAVYMNGKKIDIYEEDET